MIDASALMAIVLPEQDFRLRDATSAALEDCDLVAPSVWPAEVAGALAKAEWMKRISAASCELIWSGLCDVLRDADIATRANASELLALCRRYSLRGADATYLELAARERLPLLTGDKALARACRPAHVALVFDPNA